jgi:GT2 family glycosyltransferase
MNRRPAPAADRQSEAKIDAILPTRNRAEALDITLPVLFRVRGLSRIIVVDDGSNPPFARSAAFPPNPPLIVVRHDTSLGQPAARNAGVSAASAPWVLFAEDDCLLPRGYAESLLAAALEHEADIVGAPWIHPRAGEIVTTLSAARARRVEWLDLRSPPSTFPATDLVTPFLPALALVRRSVFDTVRFDEGFRGNAYREETDFFVSAARRGVRCVLVSSTAAIQAGQWNGGARTNRLAYEAWTLRNNWRFLTKHGAWLRASGYSRGRMREQAWFTFSRIRQLYKGRVRRVR